MAKNDRANPTEELSELRRQLADVERRTQLDASETEAALRERIKELDCLYTIAEIQEAHFKDPDKFLQGVVDCLPRSWQFPEYAAARIAYEAREFVTEPFDQGPWRQAAEISVAGNPVGRVEVFYREGVPAPDGDPFLREERLLLRAVAERVGNVLRHMKTEADLRAAHRQIQKEHQALRESNMALRTVLTQVEEEKRQIKTAILNNIQKVVMPLVYDLELEVAGPQRSFVTLLRQNLQDIAAPFFQDISSAHVELTPREITICSMIRNGLSTKEIARLRRLSPATVRRHRENIRKKLGLTNRRVNLVTYLQSNVGKNHA